jgi:hypothetical protein
VWCPAARFACLADAQFDEDALERAKSGKGGLEHVETDESGEEEPPFVDEMPKSETGEHESASDEKDDALNGHMVCAASTQPLGMLEVWKFAN